jgi:HEAT repeat protein
MGLFKRKPNIEKLAEQRDTEGLKKALNSKDAEIRMKAAAALRKMKTKEVFGFQPKVLEKKKRDVHKKSTQENAEAISKEEKGSESIESLLNALKNKDWDIREKAIRALGMAEDKKAVEPLIALAVECKQEEELKIRQGFVGDTSRRSTILNSLKRLRHPKVTEFLISNINDEPTLISYIAIDALGKKGEPEAIEPLIQALKKDPRSEIRGYAAEALGNFGNERAKEALMEALEDIEIAVQDAAKKALEKIGDKIIEKK